MDALIWLGAYRSDKAAHAMRLIQFRRGDHLYCYITNVLDPQMLPFHEVVQLYARRWDIELIFLLLKEHFGLHIWWSSKQDLMLCQLWIALILAHLLTRLRFQVAEAASVSYFDGSHPVLMDLLRRFSSSLYPFDLSTRTRRTIFKTYTTSFSYSSSCSIYRPS